jgi:osmotically-inducible protein OsmY
MTHAIRKIAAAAFVAAFALALGGCASDSPRQETTSQFMDDAVITAKVKTALFSDVGARAGSEIKVSTQRGLVQLSGFVESHDEVDKAINAARNVSGVRQVRNDIQVKQG